MLPKAFWLCREGARVKTTTELSPASAQRSGPVSSAALRSSRQSRGCPSSPTPPSLRSGTSSGVRGYRVPCTGGSLPHRHLLRRDQVHPQVSGFTCTLASTDFSTAGRAESPLPHPLLRTYSRGESLNRAGTRAITPLILCRFYWILNKYIFWANMDKVAHLNPQK
jgi:hypothetical protein